MIPIIGIVVVFGSIIAGYMIEHGQIGVLIQPAELLIILGAAIGTLLVANPLPTLIAIGKGISGVFTGGTYTKAFYLTNLTMLFELYNHARKAGTAKIEEEVDNPEKSPVFSKYPAFLKAHRAVAFLCDTLRMSCSGGVEHADIDNMMEVDLEVHHREAEEPVSALSTMADALPGLGIVAAVLGVVLTMNSLGGAKEEIGKKVASALVGTFLGILLCYGVFGPLASAMGKLVAAEADYYAFLRTAALAFIRGMSPILAVELSRRSIPSEVRPSFKEMETTCRNAGKAPPAAPPGKGAPAKGAPAKGAPAKPDTAKPAAAKVA